jgi:hypothetical protein
MPQAFQPPARLADLFTKAGADQVRRAFELLNCLQNLVVVVRNPDGTLTPATVQFNAGDQAIVDTTQGITHATRLTTPDTEPTINDQWIPKLPPQPQNNNPDPPPPSNVNAFVS